MPTRTRLFATWTTAAVLLAAAAVCLLSLSSSGHVPAAVAGSANTTNLHAATPQHAGLVLPQLLAAGLFAVAVSLLTPTALFVWRRRQYRRVLAAERG